MKEKRDIENTGDGSEESDNSESEASNDVVDVEERAFENEKEESDEESKAESKGTWPADCYSFIALHHPLEHPGFFSFGLLVWCFQIAFLILLVLRVASPTLSTNEDTDNPDEGFFSAFIPSNVSNLSRATQFMALLSYCIFADESLKDIVTAVEMWPTLRKANPGDRVTLIMMSCLMRFVQGMLATVVVLLLVITTSDVIDIILNFTAVNFISGFDDVAFELAQWGKYGPALENEANRIEELPAPPCIVRKYQHIRYRFTVIPIALVLIIMLSFVTYGQLSTNMWLTKRLRVQFQDDSSNEIYSGCYDMNVTGTNRHFDKRVKYDAYKANPRDAKFGYCLKDRKWFLYNGGYDDPCGVDELDKVAYSDKTYSFDISTVFEESWYSRSGTPLELYFFDNGNSLSNAQCDSFLGDGVCNEDFNIIDYDFDAGDCCAATCDEIGCGVGTVTNAFNVTVPLGNGFQNCIDPDMEAITIYLDDVYLPQSFSDPDEAGPFSNIEPRDPLMVLDCNGQNVLMVEIDSLMKGQSETVMVSDGAECNLLVKNSTSGPIDIWFVDYTIYHGDKDDIENTPTVIAKGSSMEAESISFQRIYECFFRKLGSIVDPTTMYIGTNASHQAIQWLMNDAKGYSNCERDGFVERFALATINFAAPIVQDDNDELMLWINEERHCVWRTVACVNGSVHELDLGAGSDIYLKGTIATEIAVLEQLVRFDIGNNELSGAIPSSVGELERLEYLGVESNNLVGTIPSELVQMTNLKWIFFGNNSFTGTFPGFFSEMPQLKGIIMWTNKIAGPIPDSIGSISSLEYLIMADNLLTGTIPSSMGELLNMTWFSFSYNALTGTIPSELSESTKLDNIEVANNLLTGSIPQELLDTNLSNFDVYANLLSDLIPVEGEVICTAPDTGGEHYCNCDVDCTFNPLRCECEEAQACCKSFFEGFTECIICNNEEYLNPDLRIDDFDATCAEIGGYVRMSLLEYGTETACEEAKTYFGIFGCFCAS